MFEVNKERDIGDLQIVDGHTHASGIEGYNFFIPRVPSSQSIAELERKMVFNGISFAIVFPMPFSLYYNPRVVLNENRLQPSGLEDFPYEVENKALMHEVSFSSGCFLPFLAIDPKERVEKQIEFLRGERNYFGFKFHPLATHSSVDDLRGSPFLDILIDRGIPLMIHCGRESNALPELVLSFAKDYPRIRICIAHLAGFDAEVISQAQSLENLFFDTSPFLNCCFLSRKKDSRYFSPKGLALDYADPLKVLVEVNKIIRGHLIWGTDEPWTTVTDPKTGEIIVRSSYEKERSLLRQLEERGFSDVKFEITNQNIKRFLWG